MAPDRDGLLALAEVGGALDVAAHEELLDLLLEEPDLHHLAVPVQAPVATGGVVAHAFPWPPLGS